MPVLERKPATDPGARDVAALPKRAVVAMEFSAAIAEEISPRGRGEEFAKGIDAILQRHDAEFLAIPPKRAPTLLRPTPHFCARWRCCPTR